MRRTGEPSNESALTCRDGHDGEQVNLDRLPIAHAGHVLIDLLMFSPVLVLIAWFAVISIRDRRREAGEDSEP
jgi:hypothetical protein